MHLGEFFVQSLSVLTAAVVVVFLSSRLRLPSVVGLVLAGMLIGPSGLALVGDREGVELFAEIGVVLLLFTIGVELSFGELRELRRPFLLGGSVQASVTMLGAAALALGLGIAPNRAVFAAFVVALSSTAVVLKLYGQRQETATPQGRVVLGILLFQDVLIVPLIVLTPLLAGAGEATPGQQALRFVGALGAIVAVFWVSRRLTPSVLHELARARVRELSVLTALLLCLASAWFTYRLGFSLALGAFIAGLVVSESEYSDQVIADIVPFRDLFASLFFISIGMLVDLRFAAERMPLLLSLAATLIVLKALAAALAVRVTGYPLRIAVIAGLGLAQVGEFSFVLMELGREHGLLGEAGFQTLLISSVVTLLATPFLIGAAPRLGDRVAGWSAAVAPEKEPEPELRNHVIVVGYGVNGSFLARVLKDAGIQYLVIDLNPDAVRAARESGVPVIFGDASRPEILRRASVEHAEVVVFGIPDARATRAGVRLVHQLRPGAQILARTRMVAEIEELRTLGAQQVIAEEFETAIEIFTRVLRHFHVPRNIIRAQTRALRGGSYSMLRSEPEDRTVTAAVLDALEAGTTDLFQVLADGRAIGRSLRDLELRQRTGASVIAVVRGEQSFVNPSPEVRLQRGDCLVLVGSHQQMEDAFHYLEGET